MSEGYTNEEIREFLKCYREIRVSELKDVALNTKIRYFDTRFKKGGKLKEMTDEKITIVSGSFKWNVLISNINKVWIEDKKKVEKEEKKLDDMERLKEYLFDKYMRKLLVITKSRNDTRRLEEYLKEK